MNRRAFIAAIGTTMVTWPNSLLAQSAALPLIGFVNNGSATAFGSLYEAFQRGLSDAGFVEGRSVNIEKRWADGHDDRLPSLVSDLAQHHPSVIVATGGSISTITARTVFTDTPIVFTMGVDPIKFGIVKSLNRPEANVTGVSMLANNLLSKQVSILHETITKNGPIGALFRSSNPSAERDIIEVTAAAESLGRKLLVAKASDASEIGPAIAGLAQRGVVALVIFPDALFVSNIQSLVAAINERRLPAIFNFAEFATAGGLLCYGGDQKEGYHQAGVYAGRVLKGEKPSELPVVQSSRLNLIVNLKTAKEFGINLSSTLLATADEVIE